MNLSSLKEIMRDKRGGEQVRSWHEQDALSPLPSLLTRKVNETEKHLGGFTWVCVLRLHATWPFQHYFRR